MLRFIEKISELLLSQNQRTLELRELKVQFVRNRQAIQQHLHQCKKSGGIIGVYATRLGKGMFLGTVTSIHYDIISLRPIEDNIAAKAIMVPLNEITSVCPFNQVYEEKEQLEVAPLEHEEALQFAHAH
jgi:hypothetical protein